MKKLLFIGLALFPLKAFANPACAVCTVAEIVSSSEGTQRRTRAFSV